MYVQVTNPRRLCRWLKINHKSHGSYAFVLGKVAVANKNFLRHDNCC